MAGANGHLVVETKFFSIAVEEQTCVVTEEHVKIALQHVETDINPVVMGVVLQAFPVQNTIA